MTKKKILALTMALVLAVTLPLAVLAEVYDLAQGSITVEAREDGQYVSQEGVADNVKQTTETVIKQTGSDTASTNNTITIQAEKNQTAQVTISDVNIDVSGTGNQANRVSGDAAISAEGDGNVTIELDGDNTAKSGVYRAGVEKNNGGNLTITDADADGALEAVGGYHGAGIGGGNKQSVSDITINGGDITAIGGNSGAGIGGGDYGSGSNITISGSAEVTANGDSSGAGIGGGSYGSGSDIKISGNAEVTAKAGNYGAGIGGGNKGNGDNIKISDNAEVTATGGLWGAGIGGGAYKKGDNITSAAVQK